MQQNSGELGLSLSPTLSSGLRDEFAEMAARVCKDYFEKIRPDEFDREEAEMEKSEDDEEFSFACPGADESPISADDLFHDGKIKPAFPLFDQSLLLASDLEHDLPRRKLVKKVFVEAEGFSPTTATKEGTEGDAAGWYSAWSRTAVEASAEVWKKSNSTGYSNFWEFREPNRSNSDGRDAFVFLNHGSAMSSPMREKNKAEKRSSEKKTGGDAKVSNPGKAKTKKGEKTETASAHEIHYVKGRTAREEDRRRSYLPYRPEVVGFFTNVHGGVRKNVHPF